MLGEQPTRRFSQSPIMLCGNLHVYSFLPSSLHALEKLMAKGPSSFFNWFEWIGKHESLGEVGNSNDGADKEEVDIVEVFIHGGELAIQLAEEVYQSAAEHFSMSLTLPYSPYPPPHSLCVR